MSDGGYGDGYDAGFFEGGKIWKAKALDLEWKRDVAVSTLEKVKADRSVAKKALAAQCIETRQLRAASRDAEVVSLTNQRDYEYVRAENAEQERDQLREQVKMLRDVLQFYMDNGICEPLYHKAKEALASTEPR